MIIFHMFNSNFRLFVKKMTKISAYGPLTVAVISTIAIGYGCAQKDQEKVQLNILDLQSASSNSKYNVTGNTNLPDSTRITVTAVRHLVPVRAKETGQSNKDANISRSILDRQNVEVKAGKWQAELNLSQVAPDGSFREVWQTDRSNSQVTPEDKVTFIATYNPASQWQRWDGENKETPEIKVNKPQGKLVRFTNEGEKFLQTSKTLSVPLPVAKTVPPSPKAKDINDGWGNRYQLNKQVSTSTGSLPPVTELKPDTNTPLKASQSFR